MHSPEIARRLRERGHDVVHASEQGLGVRADDEVLAANAVAGRATLTNDVQDLMPLVARAASEGLHHGGLLLTGDRSLPRSTDGIGRLVDAIDALIPRTPPQTLLRNRIRWLP